jgi:hypothetical protein
MRNYQSNVQPSARNSATSTRHTVLQKYQDRALTSFNPAQRVVAFLDDDSDEEIAPSKDDVAAKNGYHEPIYTSQPRRLSQKDYDSDAEDHPMFTMVMTDNPVAASNLPVMPHNLSVISSRPYIEQLYEDASFYMNIRSTITPFQLPPDVTRLTPDTDKVSPMIYKVNIAFGSQLTAVSGLMDCGASHSSYVRKELVDKYRDELIATDRI